jgi:hypothetical protein
MQERRTAADLDWAKGAQEPLIRVPYWLNLAMHAGFRTDCICNIAGGGSA